MRVITTKQDIVAYLHHERGLWDALVAEVGEAQMEVAGAMGRWTFKDLIAHLTAWWRRELGCLEALRRGEEPMPHPSPADVQIINNWTYHTQRDRSLPQLMRDVDEVWQQFEAAIQAMPERALLEAGHFPPYTEQPLGARILSDFVDHYHTDHEADVQRWLAQFAS